MKPEDHEAFYLAQQFKSEILSSVNVMIHPHIEGVWAVFLSKHERGLYKNNTQAGTINEQECKDAERYFWLFGSRTMEECTDENVGLLPSKSQDLVLGKIGTTYMHKEAVDELIDSAMAIEAAKVNKEQP